MTGFLNAYHIYRDNHSCPDRLNPPCESGFGEGICPEYDLIYGHISKILDCLSQ